MKRRIISVFLVLLIIAPITVYVRADTSGLCFTATNDTLLDLGSMAAYSGGIVYVPARVFSTYGVYYNYFDSSSTAMLYNGTNEIYFDLTTGNCSDSSNNFYSASAIFKNGQVYVPVAWVSSYFGLSYSYISGSGYGDIVRIRNGLEVLSDSQFLDAATSLMKSRYNDYYGVVNPVTPTPAQPQPSETPEDIASVSLSFIGIPSDKALDSLDSYSVKASYFVTAEEALGSPDTIRRILGSGHSLGVYCKTAPTSECSAAADAIFDAAQFRPALVTSPASISKACSNFADENGYAYYKQGIVISENTNYSDITSKIGSAKDYLSLCLTSGDNMDKNLPYILQYISAKHVTVLPLLETFV